MRPWRYLALVGGIVGVLGFFLPLLSLRFGHGRIDASVSAYRLVVGIGDVSQLIDSTDPLIVHAVTPDVQRFVQSLNEGLTQYHAALVGFFVPAALLALVGALASVRRKMGRIAGVLALALGLANVVVWLLWTGSVAHMGDTRIDVDVGVHMLLVAGIVGTLAGLGAIAVPDRPRRAI